MKVAKLGIAFFFFLMTLNSAHGIGSGLENPDAEFAVGTVFHDRNKNGVQDRFEWGIGGVAVSNGHEVAVTDWRGRYRIRVERDTILFVVKPGGWATPVDEHRIPRFYYNHKPDGSPESLNYPGVAATGPLPSRIDFPLFRRRESGSFRMVVFGDPQPYTIEEVDYFSRDIIEELVGVDAAFGISLGDIVGDDLSLFEPVNQAVSRIGIPWHNVIGNHDMNYAAESDLHSDESFERVYGPPTYAFVYGKVHFIILDDVVYAGAGHAGRGERLYIGGLSSRQLEFIENYLSTVPRERLIVLAMHIPYIAPHHELVNRRELFEILGDRPHTFSMAAHTHFQANQFWGPDDGFLGPEPHHQLIAGTTSGSWWLGEVDETGIPHAMMRYGSPNGYSIVSFDGNRYSVRFKAARRPADYQMSIFAPAGVTADHASEVEVIVNVFAGSDQTEVEMRLGESETWTALEHEAREDPYYLAAIERDLKRDPRPHFFLPPAGKSPHLWVGRLPRHPPLGTHTLEVRATDRYGQVFRAHRLIRIESAKPEQAGEDPSRHGVDPVEHGDGWRKLQ